MTLFQVFGSFSTLFQLFWGVKKARKRAENDSFSSLFGVFGLFSTLFQIFLSFFLTPPRTPSQTFFGVFWGEAFLTRVEGQRSPKLISQLHRTSVTRGFLVGIFLCNSGTSITYFLCTCQLHINCLGINFLTTHTSVAPKNHFRIICVIVSGLIVVALYRAIRLQFGYGFESCDATSRKTSKTQTLRHKGPFASPTSPCR